MQLYRANTFAGVDKLYFQEMQVGLSDRAKWVFEFLSLIHKTLLLLVGQSPYSAK
jgi:hypothetical protein